MAWRSWRFFYCCPKHIFNFYSLPGLFSREVLYSRTVQTKGEPKRRVNSVNLITVFARCRELNLYKEEFKPNSENGICYFLHALFANCCKSFKYSRDEYHYFKERAKLASELDIKRIFKSLRLMRVFA